MNHYKTLNSSILPVGTRSIDVNQGQRSSVAYSDPAISVMTDFKHTQLLTIEPSASIDQINTKMIACSVRLLFVVDSQKIIIGIVTYTDILGENPISYIQEHGGGRTGILAKDLMTEHSKIDTLQLTDVEHSWVGDIVETMKTFGRHHIVVVDSASVSGQVVSGLLSISQVERQTGIKFELSASANTFVDLETALRA